MPTQWELERWENIAKNKAVLAGLGINDIVSKKQMKKAIRKARPDPSKKRGAPREGEDAAGDEPTAKDTEDRPKKMAKVEILAGESAGLRRSARNKGKETSYKDDGDTAAAAARGLPRIVSHAARRAEMESAPRDLMRRKHDP